jgi:hypothetical protein
MAVDSGPSKQPYSSLYKNKIINFTSLLLLIFLSSPVRGIFYASRPLIEKVIDNLSEKAA